MPSPRRGRRPAPARGAVSGGWSDWVAFAQRVLQVDGLWRDREARGDAWDQGHAASGEPDAVNPYR